MTETTLMSDAATTSEGTPASSQTTDTGAQAAATSTTTVDNQQQAAEGKTQDSVTTNPTDETANSDNNQAKSDDKPSAPEKYEFKAPEGQQFDSEVIANFSEVAKELNLPQEAAQKILDKMAPAIQAQQAQAIQAVRESWTEAVKVDKEFGGEKLQENMSIAKKALDKFGTPELRTLLNESGMGDNPEVIRAFFRVGQAISEDTFVGRSLGAPQKGNRDLASSLYPNQQTK